MFGIIHVYAMQLIIIPQIGTKSKEEGKWQVGHGIQVLKDKRNAQKWQWALKEAGSGPADWARGIYSYVFKCLGIG